MIKKMLILSATVASCYAATDETTDQTLTNGASQPVASPQQDEDKKSEGPVEIHSAPELVTNKVDAKPEAKSRGFWCGGCGSVNDATDPKSAPQEFSAIGRSESVAVGEESTGESDSEGTNFAVSETATPVESVNSAPVENRNFLRRILHSISRRNAAAATADTAVPAPQQDTVPVDASKDDASKME